MMTDRAFLEALASKLEQETQVWLGFKNVERAERLRAIAAALPVEEPARLMGLALVLDPTVPPGELHVRQHGQTVVRLINLLAP